MQASVGAVTGSDVILASAFKRRGHRIQRAPERKAPSSRSAEGVDIRLHTIIYELLDELRKASVAGLLAR